MVHRRYPIFLLISLTIAFLVACEPLAPDQTPQYIIVTGETPNIVAMPTATVPIAPVESPVSVDATSTDLATPEVTRTERVVNTPVPTDTPIPIPTALPTATPFVCRESAGQLIKSSFYSDIMGSEMTYQVYLPPCFYDTLQRYPYAILLHGSGYDDQMWGDLDAPGAMDRGVSKNTLPPMVLIMPNGDWLSETNDLPAGATYADLIVDELIPLVESDFCLWGSREGRAIGGISRGGFWAFSIAFKNPEMFSVLGGHSPHFEPDNAGESTNPLDLAQTVSLDKNPMRIYIDHGADDYVGPYAMMMEELLRSRGVQVEYVVNPVGNHTMEYWSAQVIDYLSFYGKDWPFDVTALPSCLEPSP